MYLYVCVCVCERETKTRGERETVLHSAPDEAMEYNELSRGICPLKQLTGVWQVTEVCLKTLTDEQINAQIDFQEIRSLPKVFQFLAWPRNYSWGTI